MTDSPEETSLLSRDDLMRLLDAVTERIQTVRTLLGNEAANVPPVVAAKLACELAKVEARLGKLAQEARREASPKVFW